MRKMGNFWSPPLPFLLFPLVEGSATGGSTGGTSCDSGEDSENMGTLLFYIYTDSLILYIHKYIYIYIYIQYSSIVNISISVLIFGFAICLIAKLDST
jgi:hypothetical protein